MIDRMSAYRDRDTGKPLKTMIGAWVMCMTYSDGNMDEPDFKGIAR